MKRQERSTRTRKASPRSFGASLSYYFSGAVITLVSKSTVLRGLAVVLLTRELKPIRNITGRRGARPRRV